MKKIFMLCFTVIFIITAGFTFAEKSAKTGTLKVVIDGFENNEGKAMIALCNSEECYKDTSKAFMGEMAKIKDKKAEWIINKLPFGTYSISIYHDENSNNKLDTNAIGVPKENYGFSNNARAIFSAPDYEDTQFVFDKAEMTISITIK